MTATTRHRWKTAAARLSEAEHDHIDRQIDRLCDDFEDRWRLGQEPRIEDFLDRADEALRPRLLRELLLLEWEYRTPDASLPEPEEYRGRFGKLAPVVDLALAEAARPVAETEEFDLAETLLRRVSSRAVGRPDVISGDTQVFGEGEADDEIELAFPQDWIPGANRAARQLRQAWPFRGASQALIEAMAARMRRERFEVGDVLLRQGHAGRRLILLTSGQASVEVAHENQSHGIAVVGPGAVVGEMSLLTEGVCTATVKATTDGEALSLAAEEFQRLVACHRTLSRKLNGLMSDRLGGERDALWGKTVGSYRVGLPLGRGGMSVVYEAEHMPTGERVALKMMSHRLADDQDAVGRFRGEARVGRRLSEARVVAGRGAFQAFNTHFLAMRLLVGETLAGRLERDGPLSEDHARRVLGQLGLALRHAHQEGVFHRDVKPENVLLDEAGDAWLADFGLARETTRPADADRGRLIGTPRYMAPEQLLGRTVDHTADTFSLGCVAYELLTGRPLFACEELLSLICRHAAFQLPPSESIRPGLSSDLAAFLAETLARDPKERRLDEERLRRWAGEFCTPKSAAGR